MIGRASFQNLLHTAPPADVPTAPPPDVRQGYALPATEGKEEGATPLVRA